MLTCFQDCFNVYSRNEVSKNTNLTCRKIRKMLEANLVNYNFLYMQKTEKSQAIISIVGLDMCRGDYARRIVNNYDEAVQVAKEWVTDQTKCATYFEGDKTVYLKISRDCHPKGSTNHSQCTSFFRGTIV